ncbi:MAG: hypothetical protein HQK53_06375 [Oligoflexia bacterium]|nr:hypothetical protein [Oligoflexia bacterium]
MGLQNFISVISITTIMLVVIVANSAYCGTGRAKNSASTTTGIGTIAQGPQIDQSCPDSSTNENNIMTNGLASCINRIGDDDPAKQCFQQWKELVEGSKSYLLATGKQDPHPYLRWFGVYKYTLQGQIKAFLNKCKDKIAPDPKKSRAYDLLVAPASFMECAALDKIRKHVATKRPQGETGCFYFRYQLQDPVYLYEPLLHDGHRLFSLDHKKETEIHIDASWGPGVSWSEMSKRYSYVFFPNVTVKPPNIFKYCISLEDCTTISDDNSLLQSLYKGSYDQPTCDKLKSLSLKVFSLEESTVMSYMSFPQLVSTSSFDSKNTTTNGCRLDKEGNIIGAPNDSLVGMSPFQKGVIGSAKKAIQKLKEKHKIVVADSVWNSEEEKMQSEREYLGMVTKALLTEKEDCNEHSGDINMIMNNIRTRKGKLGQGEIVSSTVSLQRLITDMQEDIGKLRDFGAVQEKINEAESVLSSMREAKQKIETEEEERKSKAARSRRTEEAIHEDCKRLGIIVQDCQTLTVQKLRNVYHKLVATKHPDRGGSVEEFQQIQAAYERIMNGFN